MKSQVIGRQELLQWINEFTECDYPKVELLSDGIAYCQVIDAVHPGSVNMTKLNFIAKFPDEYMRNLKVLDDAFTKVRIDKTVPIDKLSKAKFQDNMTFLQWLFNYTSRVGPFALKSYKGYSKRQEAFQKQNLGRFAQMNAHLIPNTEFLRFKQTQFDETQPKINQLGSMDNKMNRKMQYLDEVIRELESDLKNKMEYNWKLIYALDDMQYQRETLHKILGQIDNCVIQSGEGKSGLGSKISQIIQEVPEDFTK